MLGATGPTRFADVTNRAMFVLRHTTGFRVKGDRGPEYRSLLGLPGGVNSPLFKAVEVITCRKSFKQHRSMTCFPFLQAAAVKRNIDISLIQGKGDDADTLGKKKVVLALTADLCSLR